MLKSKIAFLELKDFSAARSFSYRLPFTFIQGDYKNVSLNELANCYKFLYNIDFALKRGFDFCSFDLFYVNYFTKKFTCEPKPPTVQ